MTDNPEVWGKLILAIYCLIGLPVVWRHVRQQKMTQSVGQIQQSACQGLVVYTLAVIWPILLFAMTLTYLQQRKRPNSRSVPADETRPATQVLDESATP